MAAIVDFDRTAIDVVPTERFCKENNDRIAKTEWLEQGARHQPFIMDGRR